MPRNETEEKKADRIRQERAILQGELDRPGFQLLMSKLDEAADEMLSRYDACDMSTPQGREKALVIQLFRRVVKTEVPKTVDYIVNFEREEEVKNFYYDWLGKARKFFQRLNK